MLLVAIRAYGLAGCGGSQLGRGTMLVGAANEQHIGTGLPAKSCVDIGGQQRTNKVAEMFDAIDVGNGAGQEITCHSIASFCEDAEPEKIKKPSRMSGRAWV